MEHTTIESVFSFIDDTHIKTIDTLELKSRINALVKTERAKVVDEFAVRIMNTFPNLPAIVVGAVKEQMKGGE